MAALSSKECYSLGDIISGKCSSQVGTRCPAVTLFPEVVMEVLGQGVGSRSW